MIVIGATGLWSGVLTLTTLVGLLVVRKQRGNVPLFHELKRK